MGHKLTDLSVEEFEALVERAVERRLSVWLEQLLDVLDGDSDEDDAELRPAFAAALRRSMQQAKHREAIDLQTFRTQIGR